MTVVQVSLDVDAPPQRVWSVVADPNNLPAWDRHIVKVADVPKGGLRKGSTYTTEVRFLGARARTLMKVVDLEEAAHSKVEMHGIVDGVVETWLEPLDGGRRTHLRHRVEYRFKGGPLGEIAARAVGALGAGTILRRGAASQKRQAESRS